MRIRNLHISNYGSTIRAAGRPPPRPSFPPPFVMPSDDDFINDASDDDGDVRGPSRRQRASTRKTKGTDFEVTRTWEQLQEVDGTITGAVEGLLEASKRKR